MVGSEELPHFTKPPGHEDLEDIEILRKLLELPARLGKEEPHLETNLD